MSAPPQTTDDARPPREEGFSKDADKLVRRLSLVAFLLTRRGRPVGAAEIRRRVEGYALMTDDAFKRRFYEDRAELAELGIDIAGEGPGDEAGDLYVLPAASYYLPAIQFTPDELSALAACLFVLGDRFAYSGPLRLALLSLTSERPELLLDDVTAPVSVLPENEARRAAGALGKVQQAVAARKTISFAYYSIGRDETRERSVDPYSLLTVGDEWYLIGRCHLRDAIRTFRLSRITSKVAYATRAPHDFGPPLDFDLDAYVSRPPWQLGATRDTATVRVSKAMAWWVEAHYGHCGTVVDDDDGIVYTTGYATMRPLIAWTLSMGAAAEIVAPAALRRETRVLLERLGGRLAAPPQVPAAALDELEATRGDGEPAARRRRPAAGWDVAADRFTRLTTLMTYLATACHEAGDLDETPLEVADVCAALDIDREELIGDVRLLNLVNFGGEGTLLWAEFKGDRLIVTCELAARAFDRPARLSPLQVDTLLLAVELLGGQLPTTAGAALHSAAQKLSRARSAAPAVVAGADPLPPQESVLDAVNTAVRERRVLHIEYWSAGSGTSTSRDVEPALLVRTRGEWYYVAWCRRSEGVRTFRVATTKGVRLGDESFAPRDELEIDLLRREGVAATAQYASRRATVWYGPAVARWIAEREIVVGLEDGACLARLAYVDDPWLVHEMLRFAGEALPLAPAAAVSALEETVATLIARYR